MIEEDCYQIAALRKKSNKKTKLTRLVSDKFKSKEVLKVRNGIDDKKQEFFNKKNDKKNENKKLQSSTSRGPTIFDPYNSYMLVQASKNTSQRPATRPKPRPHLLKLHKSKTISLSQKLSDIEQTQQDEQQQNDQIPNQNLVPLSDYFLTGLKRIKSKSRKKSWSKQNRSLSLKNNGSFRKEEKRSKSKGGVLRKGSVGKVKGTHK